MADLDGDGSTFPNAALNADLVTVQVAPVGVGPLVPECDCDARLNNSFKTWASMSLPGIVLSLAEK